MSDSISFSFWTLALISIGTYLAIGLSRYRIIHRTPFRFQQHLPFELHDSFQDPAHRYQVWRWLLLIGVISLFVFWEGNFVYPTIALSYLLLALMTLWLISLMSLFIIQVKRIEIYLLIVSLFFVSTVALLFLSSYLLLTNPFSRWQTFLPWTALAQGVGQILILLNPKLKRWAILEKVGEDNEKPLYRRPAQFVMAYTQWLTIANVLLWVVLTQIEALIG